MFEILWYQLYLFLCPRINNTYLLRNLLYEIDIFGVQNFLTLIIIIFRVETIKNEYFWRHCQMLYIFIFVILLYFGI